MCWFHCRRRGLGVVAVFGLWRGFFGTLPFSDTIYIFRRALEESYWALLLSFANFLQEFFPENAKANRMGWFQLQRRRKECICLEQILVGSFRSSLIRSLYYEQVLYFSNILSTVLYTYHVYWELVVDYIHIQGPFPVITIRWK
ncbi:uncharacterized protein LOC118347991 [Juglans regia]|uniref:Uncharacterized protein LOC108979435 n=1 Tax=Juglans regia TaxID=51240 RepID=A0A6P9EHL9_JUGRE|nr:uncharacterized protein LOC108979435 [Juglans regia]XP_035544598.1 uncharacterized protein LOC118347991 [Juglans regia]